MQTEQLQNAYNRTKLKQHGISFEWAIEQPIFVMCLTRIAEAMQKPYIPQPKHAPAKPLAYKD
jgi:hypothetical protein